MDLSKLKELPFDQSLTTAVEILRTTGVTTLSFKDGKSFTFLAAVADGSVAEPVILKCTYKDEEIAVKKRQSFSKRPLFIYLDRVLWKKPGYLLANAMSQFFPLGSKCEITLSSS